jgi:hypothetical protein
MNPATKSMHLTSNTAWLMFTVLQKSSKIFREKAWSNNKHPRHYFKLAAYFNPGGKNAAAHLKHTTPLDVHAALFGL